MLFNLRSKLTKTPDLWEQFSVRWEDLELAFSAAGDEDVSVLVDRDSYWPLGHGPRQHAASPGRLNPVNGTVLIVRHVQPPATSDHIFRGNGCSSVGISSKEVFNPYMWTMLYKGFFCAKTRGGERPSQEWRRTCGRPSTTWVHQICHDTGDSATEALLLAEDKPFWRTITMAGGSGWSLRVMIDWLIGGGTLCR